MGYLGNNLQAAYSSYLLIDSISSSFNGTTTSFPLTVNGITPAPFPLNEQNVLISVGGVPQKPDASGAEGFKFSGSNIVFSSAPKTGEAFWGVVLAGADYVNAGTTYPDGSVSAPSITFGSEKTTGFYRPASGSIAVTLNGVLEATFTSNGLNLYNATGGFTAVAPSSSASNNTLTLPASNGAANQLLKNSSTAGQLTYATATEDSSGNFAFNSGYGSVAPVYGCRAWVNFDGTRDTTGAVSTANTNRLIRASGNVASVLRNSTGNYTITFTTAMPDVNYSVVSGTNIVYTYSGETTAIEALATGSFRVVHVEAGSYQDPSLTSLAIFR